MSEIVYLLEKVTLTLIPYGKIIRSVRKFPKA